MEKQISQISSILKVNKNEFEPGRKSVIDRDLTPDDLSYRHHSAGDNIQLQLDELYSKLEEEDDEENDYE